MALKKQFYFDGPVGSTSTIILNPDKPALLIKAVEGVLAVTTANNSQYIKIGGYGGNSSVTMDYCSIAKIGRATRRERV